MEQHHQKSIPNVVSVSEARTHFGQILDRAHKNNERFVVTYRGEPKVVLISIEDFITIAHLPPKVIKTLRAKLRRSNHSGRMLYKRF